MPSAIRTRGSYAWAPAMFTGAPFRSASTRPFRWVATAAWGTGGGIFYGWEGGGPSYYDNTRNFSGRLNPSASATLNNITWADPYLLKSANPCGTAAPLVCATLPGPTLVTYDRRTPYMAQWTMNIERQLGNSTVVESGYLGSVGHFLQGFHN